MAMVVVMVMMMVWIVRVRLLGHAGRGYPSLHRRRRCWLGAGGAIAAAGAAILAAALGAMRMLPLLHRSTELLEDVEPLWEK